METAIETRSALQPEDAYRDQDEAGRAAVHHSPVLIFTEKRDPVGICGRKRLLCLSYGGY